MSPLTKYLGALVVPQQFFGMPEGLYSTATILQNLLSSCMVLQRFFGVISPFKGSLRAKEPLSVLFSTIFVEEIQCNMASIMVLHSTI